MDRRNLCRGRQIQSSQIRPSAITRSTVPTIDDGKTPQMDVCLQKGKPSVRLRTAIRGSSAGGLHGRRNEGTYTTAFIMPRNAMIATLHGFYPTSPTTETPRASNLPPATPRLAFASVAPPPAPVLPNITSATPPSTPVFPSVASIIPPPTPSRARPPVGVASALPPSAPSDACPPMDSASVPPPLADSSSHSFVGPVPSTPPFVGFDSSYHPLMDPATSSSPLVELDHAHAPAVSIYIYIGPKSWHLQSWAPPQFVEPQTTARCTITRLRPRVHSPLMDFAPTLLLRCKPSTAYSTCAVFLVSNRSSLPHLLVGPR